MKWFKLLLCLVLAFGCVQFVGCEEGASEITEYDEPETPEGHDEAMGAEEKMEEEGPPEGADGGDPGAGQ